MDDVRLFTTLTLSEHRQRWGGKGVKKKEEERGVEGNVSTVSRGPGVKPGSKHFLSESVAAPHTVCFEK